MSTPTISTVSTTEHVAHLDAHAGCGVLTLPRFDPATDDGGADLGVMLSRLRGQGWVPLENNDPDATPWCLEGMTAEGCEVVGLIGQRTLIEHPSFEDICASYWELDRVAGVVSR